MGASGVRLSLSFWASCCFMDVVQIYKIYMASYKSPALSNKPNCSYDCA
jgi:hypothetical protein